MNHPSKESPLSTSYPAARLDEAIGLGLDAGGTQTRWALAAADGRILAEGHVGPLNALQTATPAGRDLWRATLLELAAQLKGHGHAMPRAVHAGLTGYGGTMAEPVELITAALQIDRGAVTASNDVEVAYRDVFALGAGHLVYAGTGAIAVHVDARGHCHRAGGLGGVLDDAGGGYWIGREALKRIWRAEDEEPGAWHRSALAMALMQRMGGSDWACTRAFLATADRGAMGALALIVAQVADRDEVAMDILEQAGRELARLGCILLRRLGPLPIALVGRVWQLHPAIGQTCREALPADTRVTVCECRGHHAAARLAASRLTTGSI
ncbi:MAG: N-acetylglucosamine kinase [Burkholderiaceae bacterium]